jgi:hypothetical protein
VPAEHRLPDNDVVASTTDEGVVAITAYQLIVSGATKENVIPIGADQVGRRPRASGKLHSEF